tara:strand:- start:1126 stop:1581 length:456 start_codon:yes stop_codon:yes gene_type:complete
VSKVYKLIDVWNQAKEDCFTANLDGEGYEARILYGCKISKDNDTNMVQLQNTSRGGEWYLQLDPDEIEIFLKMGWRIGIYMLSLSNYRLKLDRIERLIKMEVNGRKNPKQIQSLKSSRQRILEKYSKIKNQLNQLNQLNQIKNGQIKDSKH